MGEWKNGRMEGWNKGRMGGMMEQRNDGKVEWTYPSVAPRFSKGIRRTGWGSIEKIKPPYPIAWIRGLFLNINPIT